MRGILHAAEAAGVDVEPIIEDLSLDDATLHPASLIPQRVESALWRRLLSSAPDIGARGAFAWPKGTFRVLEYLVRTSGTLREGLIGIAHLHRFVHGASVFEIHLGDDCYITYQSPHRGTEFEATVTEFALASLVHLARDCTGLEAVASRLELPHARTAGDVNLEAKVACLVTYDARRAAVHFRREALDLALESADPTLNELLRELALRRMEARPSEGVVAVVRQMVENALPDEPRVGEVAARLSIKPRTLQDKLHHEGTTFRSLVDDVREALARQYLERPELDIADIAILVGYSDARAFHRAFRRWTGRTPGSFRRKAAS